MRSALFPVSNQCVLPFQEADRLETLDPWEGLHEDAVG
jgi:hypothetical protein